MSTTKGKKAANKGKSKVVVEDAVNVEEKEKGGVDEESVKVEPIKKKGKGKEKEKEEEKGEEKVESKELKQKEKGKLPTSIEEMGYEFRDDKLLNIQTSKPYEFKIQEEYELLSELVAKYIQLQMISKYKMEEVQIPLRAKHGDPTCNIFMTQNLLLQNCDKLMVLICGTGKVLAGQWSRKYCINDELKKGSILPYIEKALQNNYGILVMNPNKTSTEDNTPIKKVETPFHHSEYVWENFVEKNSVKDVVVVAHSFGGVLAVNLLRTASKKLRAIAFTDSAHSINAITPPHVKDFLKLHTINWVMSTKKLDSKVGERQGVTCLSSGVNIHELTSPYSIESVFSFLNRKSTLKRK